MVLGSQSANNRACAIERVLKLLAAFPILASCSGSPVFLGIGRQSAVKMIPGDGRIDEAMGDIPRRTRVSAIVLALTALIVVGGTIATSGLSWPRHELAIAVLLCLMIVAVEKFKVDFPHASFDMWLSVGAILSLAAALMFQPAEAALVVMVSALINDTWDRLKPIQVVVNVSNLGLATFAGAYVYRMLADTHFQPLHGPRNIGATIAAAIIYSMINTWALAIVVAPVVGQSTLRFWRSNIGFTYVFVALPAMGSLVPLVADQHPLAILVLMVPLLGSHLAQRALHNVQQETRATIESLVDALEVRDEYTHNHSVRVTEYVKGILGEMPQIPAATRQMIVDAARIHDIGKMGVRDNALLKPGKLSDEEYQEIKRHATIGADLISNLEMYRRSAPIVRHHHERWDGRGYPDGIAGEAIPLGARIIAVADSFDAMTSDRPYRRAMTFETALAEIRRNSGIQFDAAIVEAFERAMRAPTATAVPVKGPPLATGDEGQTSESAMSAAPAA